MKTLARLEKTKECWFLIITSCLFFLLRFPSLFEPYWYGDEGIYQVVGMGMNAGRVLYRDIWDNKPPLLYVIYQIFSSDQFSIRLASLIFGLLSIFAFFILAKKLFKESKTILLVTFLFAFLFAIPLLEGNIANSENFMMLPTLIAAITIIMYTKLQKPYLLIVSGILLSISFLLKAVAVFDASAFGLFLFFMLYKGRKHITDVFQQLFLFALIFLTPIMLTAVFFFLNGVLGDFLEAAFKQNVGYVGYGNQLLIPQGFLLIKLVLLFISVVFLFLKRTKLSFPTLFILVWLAFSVFNAFFSQRPYTHYVLVLLPSFILLAGNIIENILRKDKIKAIDLEKSKRLNIVLFVVLLVLTVKNFSFYSKTASYYGNFTSFIFNKKTVNDYQAFFDRNTPKDYAIAQFIKGHTNNKDSIFIWGNNAQVYALVNKLPPGRFTVAYHIMSNNKTLLETQNILLKTKPKFIIVSSSKNPLPFNLPGYAHRLIIEDANIYEYVF